ncbi:MAG: hypothetical protein LIV11_01040 [Bacillota bacterium]|nr:hypothetical protein [Bacillota bacterium]
MPNFGSAWGFSALMRRICRGYPAGNGFKDTGGMLFFEDRSAYDEKEENLKMNCFFMISSS